MIRITKTDLEKLILQINKNYVCGKSKFHIIADYYKRYYTSCIVELRIYKGEEKLVDRRFGTYRETHQYLLGVKDSLGLL